MREMRFRIWDMDRKVMLDSQCVISYGGDYYEEHFDFEVGAALNNIVVMQYTGLVDKHGNRIFEGDIVKHVRNGIIRKVYWDTHCASFHLSKRGKKESNVDYWSLSNPQWNYEVIGNVYQNNDLLEGLL